MLSFIRRRFTRCHIFHPVCRKDPVLNGSLAEQAVGLAKSLGWTVVSETKHIEQQGEAQWTHSQTRKELADQSQIRVRQVSGSYYFTKGKLEEVKEALGRSEADIMFVNAQLTSAQLNNLRQRLSQTMSKRVQVLDRFTVILQIFSKRKKSELTTKQVQLCLLKYLRGQLVRDGNTYFSMKGLLDLDFSNLQLQNLEVVSSKSRNVKGTIGGEGQTQLQLERRLLNQKQAKLIQEIKLIQHKEQQASSRKYVELGVPKIAIIGYTNAGKSQLLNSLANKKEAESRDNLFQTLGVSARAASFPTGFKGIFLDTVGFIQQLPTPLVEAFKSTLRQVVCADLLIHLVDVSNPYHMQQRQTVINTLKEAGFDKQPIKLIEVWNKIDKLVDPSSLQPPPGTILISAKTKEGLPVLRQAIQQLSKQLLNKQTKKLKYCLTKHEVRRNWLITHGYTFPRNQQYFFQKSRKFPYGWVEYQVTLDQALWGKFFAYTQGTRKDRSKGRDMPPADWESH